MAWVRSIGAGSDYSVRAVRKYNRPQRTPGAHRDGHCRSRTTAGGNPSWVSTKGDRHADASVAAPGVHNIGGGTGRGMQSHNEVGYACEIRRSYEPHVDAGGHP